MTKKYRFFYHYFRQKDCMSVHFRGQCHQCKDVVCDSPTETKWNKSQPRLTIRGFASEIEKINGIIYIKN